MRCSANWLSDRLAVARSRPGHPRRATRGAWGAAGVRDEGLLESALARPLKMFPTRSRIGELAALYALGIARNHPFVDGNKRTAYVALETFLQLNGALFG